MSALTLALSQQVIAGTLGEARSRGARPLAVVILDAGGHLVALAREDGASFYRDRIAVAKARGALGMGSDTRDLARRAAGNPVFFQSVAVAVGGDIAFSPGGVLLRDATGAVIGAVGVSGDTADCDEECARAGIGAAGLENAP